jgi:hypothetical protein
VGTVPDGREPGGPDDGPARLRAAAAAVEDLGDPASGSDPMEHADRFEALHEALAAALAAVDRG